MCIRDRYCTYVLRNSLKYFYATNKYAIDLKEKDELATDLQGKLTDRLLAREKDRLKHEGQEEPVEEMTDEFKEYKREERQAQNQHRLTKEFMMEEVL